MATLHALQWQKNAIDERRAQMEHDDRELARKAAIRGQNFSLMGDAMKAAGSLGSSLIKGGLSKVNPEQIVVKGGKHANHPSDHNKAEKYFKLSTMIGFGTPLTSEITDQGRVIKTPGIMVLNYIQTLGNLSKGVLSVVNNVFQHVYDFVRHANSGAVNNYDPNDYALINIAAYSCMTAVSEVRRICKVLLNSSEENFYLGAPLFAAMIGTTTGYREAWIKWEKYKITLAQRITEWVQKLNQVPIPDGIALPGRWIRFADEVIADDYMTKTQYYVMKAKFFWRYNPLGSSLEPIVINFADPEAVESAIDVMVNNLFTATSVRAMFGDIMKWFDDNHVGYYQYYNDPADYIWTKEDLDIVYDEFMLDQIKNSVSLPDYSRLGKDFTLRDFEFSNFSIIADNTDPLYGGIVCRYSCTTAGSEEAGYIINGLRLFLNTAQFSDKETALPYLNALPHWDDHLLNVDADVPSPDMIMMASRLKCRYEVATDASDYRWIGLDVKDFSTEVIFNYTIIGWNSENLQALTAFNFGSHTFFPRDEQLQDYEILNFSSGATTLLERLNTFSFHPTVYTYTAYAGAVQESGHGANDITPVSYSYTLRNFTTITSKMLENLNRASLYSLLTPTVLYSECGLTNGSDSASKEGATIDRNGKPNSKGKFKGKAKKSNKKKGSEKGPSSEDSK